MGRGMAWTNKAAQEVAEGVEGPLGSRIAKGMCILTFHSACVRILRQQHELAGLPSHFSIYDEGDTERVLTIVLREMNVDPKRYPPRQVAAVIGHAKDQLIGPEEFARDAANYYEATVAGVYAEYQARL